MAKRKPTPARKTQARRPAPKPAAKPGRRRNPSEMEAAAARVEEFHGRPARRVREIEEPAEGRTTLAVLGALEELHVETDAGELIEVSFPKGVKLCCDPDGRQLYLVGGNQTVDLAEFGLNEIEAARDHVYLGRCRVVIYHTRKGFHNFKPTNYSHEFGEEKGGRPPALNYDTLNARLYLSGGTYTIKPEGITN